MIRNITDRYDFISIDSNQWTEGELNNVNTALRAAENTFGGADKFKTGVGNVTLYRRDKAFLDNFRETPAVGGVTNGITRNVTIYDVGAIGESDTVFTVLHELGHIYDINNGLPSSDFEDEFWEGCLYIVKMCLFGGSPADDGITDYGNTSPNEDFADTFAATIFDDNFKQPNMNMPKYPPGVLPFPGYVRKPSDARKNYIKGLLME